jgi:hypothetical protein
MAVSLPSNFTPVPQVLLPHMRQAFVARSLALLGRMIGAAGILGNTSSGGPGMPFAQVNEPLFANGGQFIEGPTFVRMITANRRDITSNAALVEAAVTGVNNKGVVCNRRTNLAGFADDTFLTGFTNEQISAELGMQTGEMVADDLCSTIIAACIGIVEATTASANTVNVWNTAVRTNLSPNIIDQGRFKLGDRYEALTHALANSFAQQDMRSDATGRNFTGVGNLALQGADNTNWNGLVPTFRDDASLQIADAGFDKCVTLLFGAHVLEFGFYKPVTFESIRFINRETKTTDWRGDWDIWMRCTSRAYNDGAGGANPTNTTLASSANWTDTTSSARELALVEIIHNASGLS